MSEQNNLIVYCEFEHGKVADVSLELLTKARELANALGCKAEALVLGTNLGGVEKELASYGADIVWIGSIAAEVSTAVNGQPFVSSHAGKTAHYVDTEFQTEGVYVIGNRFEAFAACRRRKSFNRRDKS